MFGTVVGYATVKPKVSENVLYPFGPLSDIEGKRLPVLERNRDGDCLCVVNGGASLADIRGHDIARYDPV